MPTSPSTHKHRCTLQLTLCGGGCSNVCVCVCVCVSGCVYLGVHDVVAVVYM